MKTRILYLLAAALIAASCSTTLDKSMMEPLSQEEIDYVAAKDTGFVTLYDNVSRMRKAIVVSPKEKTKYMKLTYKRILDYLNVVNDKDFEESIDAKHRSMYETNFPSYRHETDSIIAYWRKFRRANPKNDEEIPESVMRILTTEACIMGVDSEALRKSVQPMLDVFRHEVVRELVDPNYISFDELFPLILESEKKIYDPLVHELLKNYETQNK